MNEVLDNLIAEYFNDEKNLHKLRLKLFDLSAYRLQSDFDKEFTTIREEYERDINNLKDNHNDAIKKINAEHQQELSQLSEQHKADMRQKNSEFATYKSSVAIQMQAAEQNKIELERWQSDYSELDEAYRNFSNLSDKHKDAIAGIFGGCDTPLDFLCGSVQKVHLEQLWDYMCDELNALDFDDSEYNRFSSLFDFSFNAVNRSQREPLYRRLTATPGDAFNADTMRRTTNSKQLGRVNRLVFAGFAHEVTGSVVRCSLVDLE